MVDFISSGIRLGQMCDLSRDVVAGLPVISMLGDCEVFIENYRGILEYSSEYLKVSTKIGNIRVSGSNLVIYHMNQDEILLRGRIGKVSLKGEADELHSTTNDGNIISGYSGVIEYIITRSGTPKVTVGDEVSEGDILVENTLYVPDDYEENIQQFQTRAQADILIRTQLSWDKEINAVYADKIYTGRKMTTYAISIDKYEISLGFPRHLKEYDKVVNEGNIKIGNLIALPVSVQKITLNEYKENEAEYSEEEAAAILNEKAERFIKHLKENEVQINDYHVNIERSGDKYIAHADIDATVPADFDVRKVETSDE